MPGFMGREIRTRFVVVSLPEDIGLEMSGTGKLLHVITIPPPSSAPAWKGLRSWASSAKFIEPQRRKGCQAG